MSFTFFITFCAILQLNGTRGSTAIKEPVCSKFSYEEKLLEKIIRTEIKVETIQNEIKKTEDTVLKTLEDIKKTAADIYDKFEDFRNNLTEGTATKMKELQKEEEHFASKFEELRSNVSKKMKTEMDKLAEIKEQMIKPTVAFHARNVKDLILDVQNEILVFDNIITNEGSGYDENSGIFTAPVGGVYYFTVHVCPANSKHTPIGLVLDGTFIAKSMNYDTDSYTCGSVGVIIKMTSGEKVWVTVSQASTGYRLQGDYIYSFNTFSGVLISY